MIAAWQVIWIKKIGTVFLSIANSNNIKLYNITLSLGCDLNFISLGQLWEVGITYHDNPTIITLI